MRLLVLALALVLTLVVAYALLTARTGTGLEIHQTSLETFAFDLLLTRQPVMVTDAISRLPDVVAAWFGRWNLVGATTQAPPPEARTRNRSKFMLVHGGQTKAAVELTNPAHPDTTLRVLVPPHALLIAPYLWDVAFPDGGVSVTGVDDWATRLLRGWWV